MPPNQLTHWCFSSSIVVFMWFQVGGNISMTFLLPGVDIDVCAFSVFPAHIHTSRAYKHQRPSIQVKYSIIHFTIFLYKKKNSLLEFKIASGCTKRPFLMFNKQMFTQFLLDKSQSGQQYWCNVISTEIGIFHTIYIFKKMLWVELRTDPNV